MNAARGKKTASGKQIKKKKGANFRSGLERKVSKSLKLRKVSFEYETEKIQYVTLKVRNYIPDFVVTTKTGKKIYIETKGIWDQADRKKHLLIKQQHPELDIRFIFSNSKSKIAKGSQTTYADICNGLGRGEYKGMIWKFADKKIPKEWLEEENNEQNQTT